MRGRKKKPGRRVAGLRKKQKVIYSCSQGTCASGQWSASHPRTFSPYFLQVNGGQDIRLKTSCTIHSISLLYKNVTFCPSAVHRKYSTSPHIFPGINKARSEARNIESNKVLSNFITANSPSTAGEFSTETMTALAATPSFYQTSVFFLGQTNWTHHRRHVLSPPVT